MEASHFAATTMRVKERRLTPVAKLDETNTVILDRQIPSITLSIVGRTPFCVKSPWNTPSFAKSIIPDLVITNSRRGVEQC